MVVVVVGIGDFRLEISDFRFERSECGLEIWN
jgi:hypothetical protein